MIATCWVHIGVEKTGTTTIQAFLARNRHALRQRGFLYPQAPGHSNHMALACFAMEDGRYDNVRQSMGIRTQDQLQRYRSRLSAAIDREIGSSTTPFLIFSNEHLSSRLRTTAEVHRLKSFCDRIATNTKIIVYLRNQVDLFVSRYVEAVKGGSTRPFLFRDGSGLNGQFDYQRMLARWSAVFGGENLIVRRFEPADFEGEDLLLDFGSQCGFDGCSLERVAARNVAPDRNCVEFLREFNNHVPHMIDGKRNPRRGQVVSDLECAGSGEPFLVSNDVARAIEEQFRASNEAVSAEYFGGRHRPLFSPPRKIAMDSAAAKPMDAMESTRIAAFLWQAQQDRINARAPSGAAAVSDWLKSRLRRAASNILRLRT